MAGRGEDNQRATAQRTAWTTIVGTVATARVLPNYDAHAENRSGADDSDSTEDS